VTRYQVPVSQPLLDERPWLPVEGFRLISEDGPQPGHPGVVLCAFEDDDAPAELEGKIVEPVFRRSGGRFAENEPLQPFRTVIIDRRVIG